VISQGITPATIPGATAKKIEVPTAAAALPVMADKLTRNVVDEALSLKGRVALVVGGASGIGAATASLLADRGAEVVVADLAPAGSGGALALDATDPAAVSAAVASVVSSHGRLDIAVNSAGVSGTYANLVDTTVEEWRRVLDVNLTSVFLCVQAELRQMLAQSPAGGAIVNVASAAGAMGVPGLAHYAASKHGVIGLTKTAALEVVRKGIRVNAVLPGTVRTPMLQAFAGGDEGVDQMAKVSSPLARAAEPSEIAEAIAFLCTPAASYITGASLPVDAGSLAT
jgi:NAD(P)-dependent dehydrogenase (short-subunit alcohol dehydrogenase family)